MEIKDKLLDIDMIKNSKKTLLDLFIRRTAVITSTPETMVEKIIKDQWNNASKISRSNSSVSEIDICNIGVIYLSKPKSKRRINKLTKHITELESQLGNDSEDDIKILDKISKTRSVIRDINFKNKVSEC